MSMFTCQLLVSIPTTECYYHVPYTQVFVGIPTFVRYTVTVCSYRAVQLTYYKVVPRHQRVVVLTISLVVR